MTARPMHPRVPHPDRLLPVRRFNGWVAERLTRILGSAVFFYVCFAVPLLVLPGPDWAKVVVTILSSSWVQLWALAVLQMGANKADDMRRAMADAAHLAQVHIATVGDLNYMWLSAIAEKLGVPAPTDMVSTSSEEKAP